MRNSGELTWDDLVLHEPKLAHLLALVAAIKDEGGPYFCANEWWFGWGRFRNIGFKSQLSKLVGWDREDPKYMGILGGPEAYELAYTKLYDTLPPCRDCGCPRE